MSVIAVDILAGSPIWGEAEGWRADVETAVAMAAAAADAEIVDDAELSLLLTDDAAIRVLNRDHRDLDKPTNVLSFPYEDEPLMGDIVFCPSVIYREAREQGKTVTAHMAHLVVHGMLHLMGYDHLNDHDAKEMETLETEILADLGFANPYA